MPQLHGMVIKMYQTDCIAAIATPSGTGGVAIVRISGKGSLEVADRVFRAADGRTAGERSSRTLYYGEIAGDGFLDRGMCVIFRAPHSYTGEDSAELHCHGGVQIVQGVLRSVLAAGARMAENGEFTKRAFLNGKLDLSSCEGVADMIHARSAAETRAASRLMEGGLCERVSGAQDRLTDLISQLEVLLDYPEEELPQIGREEFAAGLKDLSGELKSLSDTYLYGSKLRSGLRVALCGKTNAGKSSLLNRLLGEEKAIVTEIEGTTRDVVEGELELSGMRLLLQDTAGLRESQDEVEVIGIERSRRAAEQADLVLYVRDLSEADAPPIELPANCPVVTVWNKCDLSRIKSGQVQSGGADPGRSPDSLGTLQANCAEEPAAGRASQNRDSKDLSAREVTVSARTGEGIAALRELLTKFAAAQAGGDELVLTNERHYRTLLRAQDALAHALEGISEKPCDLLALDVRECWDILGEITGVTATEDILDRIFSKFCLGK